MSLRFTGGWRLAIPAWLALSMIVAGDTVRLRNGHELEGLVTEQTADRIVLSIGIGSVNLKPAEVAEIQRSDPAAAARLRAQWQARYFTHDKYVPEGLGWLAAEFKDLEGLHSAARVALDFLRGLPDKKDAREKDLARLREETAIAGAELKVMDPKANVKAYNELVTQFNRQQAEMATVHNEVVNLQDRAPAAQKTVTDYINQLPVFAAHFAAARSNQYPRAAAAQVDLFFREMDRRLAELQAEIQQHDIPYQGRKGGIQVTARINGALNARMVVDTGADVVTISEFTAQRLNLNLARAPSVTVSLADGSTATGRGVVLDSFAVGDITLRRVAAIVLPGRPGADLDGLLGMNVLRRFIVRLDPAGNRMRLQTLRDE